MTDTNANANHFEISKEDNFVVLLDVSASMGTADCPGNTLRIEYAKEMAIKLTNEAAQYDDDGVEVYSFGQEVKFIGQATGANATHLITPLGANEMMTNTHLAINKAYEDHKQRKAKGNKDQTVVFIVTDGAPTDKIATIDAIVNITKEVPPKEICFGFLTVGAVDSSLQAFLTDLDDNLVSKYGAAYDCVDQRPLESITGFFDAFNVAVND